MNGQTWAGLAGDNSVGRGEGRILSVRDGVYYITLRLPGQGDALEIALPGVMTDVDASQVLALFGNPAR